MWSRLRMRTRIILEGFRRFLKIFVWVNFGWDAIFKAPLIGKFLRPRERTACLSGI